MRNTELLAALQAGEIEKVREGLAQQADPDYNEEGEGYTLLHWAAQEGDIDTVTLLVRHGAQVDAIDENGITPLFNAAGEGNLEMVTTLVELGADVNHTSQAGTALHNAAAYGNEDIARFLLSRGANVDALDDQRRTPLFDAVHGELSFVQLLLENGADKNHRDSAGYSPGDEARQAYEATLATFQSVIKLLD